MKSIIVARVSTEEQKEAGNSLPAQTERMMSYCKRRELEVIKSISFDESAYKDKRDEFDRLVILVQKLSKKEKVAVCFDKVDRLSRSIFDKRVNTLYEMAVADKIELHFVSDGQVINNQMSATEKFQFSMSLGLAKYYSDAISDNVKRAYEEKIKRGEWIGQAYVGYLNVTLPDESKNVIVDEERAFLVKRMFELYATTSYSMKGLAAEMKLQGLTSRAGVEVSTSQVQAMLRNPFYYGMMRIKGKLYPHKYEPLVSKYLFDKVQEHIDGYNRQNFKRTNKPYIFRGLIKCSHCGCAITPEEQKGLIYYHCTNYHGNCPSKQDKWFKEEELLVEIKGFLQSLKLENEALEELKKELRATHEAEKEYYEKSLGNINRKLGAIDARLKVMYTDRLDGRITTSEYDTRVKDYKKEQEDLLEQYKEHSTGDKNFYITANKILELSQRAWELFENSEPQEKTQLVSFLLQNLVLERRKLLFEVKTPFNGIVEYSTYSSVLRD
ncbi:MAG: Recombinase [Parcubacteria group bacterium GW2011_GWD2_38_11]|nr:MAG: Recombinase [Parcubacteria group bacterium GW2011_GWD2_38_11]